MSKRHHKKHVRKVVKVTGEVCNICPRPAVWSDGRDHYCKEHEPLPSPGLTFRVKR